MGLFSRKIKNPVKGTAEIIACSRHGGEGRWQNCRMQLVVHVEGHQAYPAEVHQIAPRAKWPQPGMRVPVDVDPKDSRRVKVDFDAMEDTREVARRMAAEQAAAAASGQTTMGAGMPAGFTQSGPTHVNIVGDPNDLPPEKLAQVEQMLGMDLDGDGTVGGTPSPGGSAVPSGGTVGDDDRLAKLERLASLRASGVLSDDEFEQEKRRILGG